jgi:hypothetical protein
LEIMPCNGHGIAFVVKQGTAATSGQAMLLACFADLWLHGTAWGSGIAVEDEPEAWNKRRQTTVHRGQQTFSNKRFVSKR